MNECRVEWMDECMGCMNGWLYGFKTVLFHLRRACPELDSVLVYFKAALLFSLLNLLYPLRYGLLE